LLRGMEYRTEVRGDTLILVAYSFRNDGFAQPSGILFSLSAGSITRVTNALGANPFGGAVLISIASHGCEDAPVPADLVIAGNYPNPFTTGTVIRFGIAADDDATVLIVSTAGSIVRQFLLQSLRAGYHELYWDGRTQQGVPVAIGSYFCRIVSGNRSIDARMLRIQ